MNPRLLSLVSLQQNDALKLPLWKSQVEGEGRQSVELFSGCSPQSPESKEEKMNPSSVSQNAFLLFEETFMFLFFVQKLH